jgi:ribose/xylose/arabinose/galactoside ABC-type transport system permease subunit
VRNTGVPTQLLNVTAYWQMVAKGAIILAAVYLGYRQAR